MEPDLRKLLIAWGWVALLLLSMWVTFRVIFVRLDGTSIYGPSSQEVPDCEAEDEVLVRRPRFTGPFVCVHVDELRP